MNAIEKNKLEKSESNARSRGRVANLNKAISEDITKKHDN